MKFVSPFEPIKFWAQGPWLFFNMGLRFMQTWQKECFSRLSLVSDGGKVLAPKADRPTETPCEIQSLTSAIATRQGREVPLLGCLQNAKVVGGPVADAIVTTPVVPVVKARQAPTELVAPVASELDEAPAVAGSSVTSMLAMQAKSLVKAVKTVPVSAGESKPAANRAAKPAAKSAQVPVKSVVKKVAAPKAKSVASKKT